MKKTKVWKTEFTLIINYKRVGNVLLMTKEPGDDLRDMTAKLLTSVFIELTNELSVSIFSNMLTLVILVRILPNIILVNTRF